MTQPQDARSSRFLVMRAAGLVGAALLVGRVVGLAREIVTRSLLGVTSVEATAFDVARAVPEAIFLILAGGAIGSAFIPTFLAYFERDDEQGAWHLFAAIINLVTIGLAIACGLAMLFAEQIVTFFYADNIAADPTNTLLPLTVTLMRIMLLTPVIFGVSGVCMSALNARQHFLLPALAPTVYNLGIITGALLWKPPVIGLALGSVLGALAHLLIQIPALRRYHAHYQPRFTVRDPGVIQVGRLMAPRVLGLSFSEINKLIIVYLTGSMPLGSLPALTTAFRLLIMPQGIIGQSLGIASFPTMATLAARSDYDELRHVLIGALRMLLYLGLPATVLLISLAEPIVSVLFQYGNFGLADTALVATALRFYATGLLALMFLEVVARAFYALSDTVTPVLAGGAQVLLMTLLSLWLSRQVFPQLGWLALGGLALGFSLSNYAEMLVLLWLLRRRIHGLNGPELLAAAWRLLLSSGVMAACIWLLLSQLPSTATWLRALLGALVGSVVYLGATAALRVSESQHLLRLGLARLGRPGTGR